MRISRYWLEVIPDEQTRVFAKITDETPPLFLFWKSGEISAVSDDAADNLP